MAVAFACTAFPCLSQTLCRPLHESFNFHLRFSPSSWALRPLPIKTKATDEFFQYMRSQKLLKLVTEVLSTKLQEKDVTKAFK